MLLYRKSQEQPWNYMYSVSKSGKKTLVCHSNGRGQPEPQSKTVSKEQQNLTSSTSWPRSIEVLFIALTVACRACHASAPAPQVKQGFLEFAKLLAVLSNRGNWHRGMGLYSWHLRSRGKGIKSSKSPLPRSELLRPVLAT